VKRARLIKIYVKLSSLQKQKGIRGVPRFCESVLFGQLLLPFNFSIKKNLDAPPEPGRTQLATAYETRAWNSGGRNTIGIQYIFQYFGFLGYFMEYNTAQSIPILFLLEYRIPYDIGIPEEIRLAMPLSENF
jgi:hypothetical protein